MIYVRLRGRIGNQLFIYSIARNLSLNTNQKVTICTRNDNKKDFRFKEFENDLKEFNISPEIIFDDTFKFPWYANNDFLLTKFFRKLSPGLFFKILSKFNVFLWFGETFKEFKVNPRYNSYIDGFWQSELYFLDNFEQIVFNELKMKSELSKYNRKFLTEIISNESVCVTIRRGDYYSNKKIRDSYYVCDEIYFQKSIKKMLDLKLNCKLVIFSDDIEWAMTSLTFPEGTLFESGKDSVSEKLYLMSKCKHFILSNSSFSWWAQEMSAYRGKIVICPKYWYKDKRKCDIYKKDCILID